MGELTAADFQAGESYRIETANGPVALSLDRVETLSGSPRPGGGFRLEFLGSADRMLAQATYRFDRGAAAWDIFIVPVAREGESFRYEAVFN